MEDEAVEDEAAEDAGSQTVAAAAVLAAGEVEEEARIAHPLNCSSHYRKMSSTNQR